MTRQAKLIIGAFAGLLALVFILTLTASWD